MTIPLISLSKRNRIMQLQLDTELIHDENDRSSSNHANVAIPVRSSNHGILEVPTSPSSLEVFRRDGISIGCDYLRINDETYTRHLLQDKNIRIHEMIGHGAFSTVFRGTWYPLHNTGTASGTNSFLENPSTDDAPVDSVDVAIKLWTLRDLSSAPRQKMLLQELRTLSAVFSEDETPASLVQLYGAFWNPDPNHRSITLVLEYMNRGSLEEFIRKDEFDGITHGLSEITVAAILYQMLVGLSILHDHRILHRDLKPANVLLHSNGQVKLCDFGIATASPNVILPDEDLSLLNRTVVGTTKFMSPERLRAQPYGRSSDIWSLGCILYQCLTRTGLWNTAHSMVDLLMTMEEMTVVELLEQLYRTRYPNHLKDDPALSVHTAVSDGLQEILVGCLQLDPAKRMPARLLLQSPWFSEEQDILQIDDSIERLRERWEQQT